MEFLPLQIVKSSAPHISQLVSRSDESA